MPTADSKDSVTGGNGDDQPLPPPALLPHAANPAIADEPFDEEEPDDDMFDSDEELVTFDGGGEFEFDETKHRAHTARHLAYILTVTLGLSFLLHYTAICVATPTGDSTLRIKAFESAFNAWLPLISGLVSAAATYYFTRDRKE